MRDMQDPTPVAPLPPEAMNGHDANPPPVVAQPVAAPAPEPPRQPNMLVLPLQLEPALKTLIDFALRGGGGAALDAVNAVRNATKAVYLP